MVLLGTCKLSILGLLRVEVGWSGGAPVYKEFPVLDVGENGKPKDP